MCTSQGYKLYLYFSLTLTNIIDLCLLKDFRTVGERNRETDGEMVRETEVERDGGEEQ